MKWLSEKGGKVKRKLKKEGSVREKEDERR